MIESVKIQLFFGNVLYRFLLFPILLLHFFFFFFSYNFDDESSRKNEDLLQINFSVISLPIFLLEFI